MFEGYMVDLGFLIVKAPPNCSALKPEREVRAFLIEVM